MMLTRRIITRNASSSSGAANAETGTTIIASGQYGALWSRGHETFSKDCRRILSVQGKGSVAFLQGIVTADLLTCSTVIEPRRETATTSSSNNFSLLRPACFLDARGRVLTDALIWNVAQDKIYLDVPADCSSDLLHHLHQYKVGRSTKNVLIQEENDVSIHVIHGTLHDQNPPPGFICQVDPRHPSLGLRLLQLATLSPHEDKCNHFVSLIESSTFPNSNGTYNLLRRLAGIAEGKEITGKTPLETNQDFLRAISFHKGCYLGQELTARANYTGIIRKRILPCILLDTHTQIPPPFVLTHAHYTKTNEGKTGVANEDEDDDPEITSSASEPMQKKKEPFPFPRLGVTETAAFVSILQGTKIRGLPPSMKGNPTKGDDDNSSMIAPQEDQTQQEQTADNTRTNVLEILEELTNHGHVGSKITNKLDGRTVGEIIASPMPGTSVIVAQMRLEWLGMLDTIENNTLDDTNRQKSRWKLTNKVVIGDGKKELRCLPCIPLWWPNMNFITGKEKS